VVDQDIGPWKAQSSKLVLSRVIAAGQALAADLAGLGDGFFGAPASRSNWTRFTERVSRGRPILTPFRALSIHVWRGGRMRHRAMIKGLHHNAYRCRDSEQTPAFYEDFLGLRWRVRW